MSVTENILKVKNVQGNITSIIDRFSSDRLVNQEYSKQLALTQNPKWLSKDWFKSIASSAVKLVSYPSKTAPIEYIPLDVVVRYTPEMSATVTSNPTQFGINVNDHAYNNPDTLTIVFGSSDIKGSLVRLQGVVKSFTSLDALKNPESPSRSLLDLLYRAKQEHTLFSIDDGLHAYTNMVITNITYDRDKTTYRTLVATVTLQQFIFVDTLEVGSKRPSVVPGSKSTFASAWDRITAIRLV